MMIRRLILLLFIAVAASAQEVPAKKPPTLREALAFARAWLDAQRSYDEIPGMSAAIVHDQQLLWSGGTGYADPSTKRPATADTIYSICSISKLFTSIAVMQLRDAGKVSLDEPLSTYLPWFTMQPLSDSGPVTLGGILTHSSGLPRESDYPYWSGKFEFPTHEQIVDRIRSQSMLYPSDTYFQYSNLGLTLAGEVVAARSGQPYAGYVRTHILQPLHLQSTTPEIPLEEQGRRLAAGYSGKQRDGSRALLPIYQVRGIAPAAGYASTANDLATFAQWQFRTLDHGDTSVLNARTLREMYRVHFVDPDFETYNGLGFGVKRDGDKTFVGHGGSCPGFRTEVLIKPDEKVATVVLANASGVDTPRYVRALYDIVSPAIGSKSDSVADSSLAPFLGSYNNEPWGGEKMFFEWGDQLAEVDLPDMTPLKNLQRFQRTGANTFRRIRKDNTLGEEIFFQIGQDGRATSVMINSNPKARMPNVSAPLQ